jgi:hypothetical protein
MKPTMRLKDSKMMKTKPRANYKRFGAFLVGSLNEWPFNRNGCIEPYVISSFAKGYPLKCVVVYERT